MKKDVFVSGIKGFIVGIASYIPSLSISSLLLSVSSYENVVDGFSDIKKSDNKALHYIAIPIFVGIILGMIAGFHLVSYVLNRYRFQTIMLFVGLLIGGIRIIAVKKELKLNKGNIFIPIIILILSVLLILFSKDMSININNNVLNIIVLAVLSGMYLIIPSVSVNSFHIKDGYKSVLSLFNNTITVKNILLIVMFIAILIVVFAGLIKLVKRCFDKNKNNTYLVLCSLVLVNVVLLVLQIGKVKLSFVSIFTSLLAFLWGFIFAKNVERE